MTHEMVKSTSRQVEDGRLIRSTVESVSYMATEMFDNMEMRRIQSAEVVKELESMKNLTCQDGFIIANGKECGNSNAKKNNHT